MIPKPAGLVEDDLMIAQITSRGGTGEFTCAPTATGTWTVIRTTNSTTTLQQVLLWKVATAADVAATDYTFSFDTTTGCPSPAASKASGGIAAFYGINNAAPIDANSGLANASSTTIATTAITNGTIGNFIVGAYGTATGTTVTAPTGNPTMTERFDNASTGGTTAEPHHVRDGDRDHDRDRIARPERDRSPRGRQHRPADHTRSRHRRADERRDDRLHRRRQRLRQRHKHLLRRRFGRQPPAGGHRHRDGSGVSSVVFPALGGTTTGWTHTTETLTTPVGGPYDTTNNFAWTAGTSSSPTEGVVATDKATNTTTKTVTFVNDITDPTGGAISVPGNSGASVTVTTTNYTDAGSGIASNVITRSAGQAPLIPGVSCPASGYSGSTVVTSPDSTVTDGQCYVYTLTGTDNVGNAVSVTSSPVLVDTSSPASSAGTAGVSSLTFAATVPNKPMRMLVVGAEAEFATNNSCQVQASPTAARP